MNVSIRYTIFVSSAILIALFFNNCSDVTFGTGQTSTSSPGGNGAQSTPPTTSTPSSTTPTPVKPPVISPKPPTIGTTTAISTFRPALAVRDISCLGCHANIQSNVITDFGFPNTWFMGGLSSANDFGGRHYMATTWQTMAQITGQVIVPSAATVPNAFVQSELQANSTLPTGDVSLLSYLTNPNMKNFGGGWYNYFGEPTPTNFSLVTRVSPGSGNAPVSAQSTIYIGAPTAQEILAIVGNSSPAPWVQAKGASITGVSGLSIYTGVNNTSYVTNSGPVQCSGQDIVVNGTLLINNGQFFAEYGGCRLYVTGSVFIVGPITYLNSGSTADPTDNIQITSATSIIMGVGLNGNALNGDGSVDNSGQNPLKVRLISDVRGNLLFRGAPTATASQAFAQSILAEGTNIGLPLLQDASVPGSLPTALSAAKQARASINFQHLLLNAPMIHSRYMGNVAGVIVAESAEFSLGEFSFSFDPIFQTVPILPALPYDIVCSGTPCVPANP